jgi:N-methylhydantoinase B
LISTNAPRACWSSQRPKPGDLPAGLAGLDVIWPQLLAPIVIGAILFLSRCDAPAGSCAEAQAGARTVTIGAFRRAVPERLPASPGSAVSIMNVKTSTRSGQPAMASIGPVGGGAFGDVAEGSGANLSFLKNTPAEIGEAEIPIRIRRYSLVPESGGPGRHRGGTGLEREFQLDAPQSTVTARNRDRSVFSAWGLVGGHAGAVSHFVKNPGTAKAVNLGSQDIVTCDPGDFILIQGPGAGGSGSPLDRPTGTVLIDVERGLVSMERARSDYGVVIAEGAVDEAATARLREQMRSVADTAEFGFGPGRFAFEAIRTAARYAALTRILAAVPVNWRYFVKNEIFAQIQRPPAKDSDGTGDIRAAYAMVTERFTDLPHAP